MPDICQGPERVRIVLEEATLDAIDGDRARFENTRNPLFAWQALASWIAVNRTRAGHEIAPLPIPEWVVGYLSHTFARILNLANGCDYDGRAGLTRNRPPEGNGVTQPRRDAPRVTPEEAMKEVPAALGLVHKRWNAFKHKRALDSQEFDEMSVDLYKETDTRVSDRRAFEMLRENKGMVQVRYLRRRIAKAREARGVEPAR
jgi:hypothetical protein